MDGIVRHFSCWWPRRWPAGPILWQAATLAFYLGVMALLLRMSAAAHLFHDRL
jgi:hypothetical protein